MGWFEIAFVAIFGTSCVLALIVITIGALTGRDLEWMERQRTTNADYYNHSKRILRINGPLVAVMCGITLSGSVLGVCLTKHSHSIWLAGVLLSVPGLWLSVRWSRWAWRR